jgi:hypothetical protein
VPARLALTRHGARLPAALNHDRTAPNMCLTEWLYGLAMDKRGRYSWRRLFTKRRGKCCLAQFNKEIKKNEPSYRSYFSGGTCCWFSGR